MLLTVDLGNTSIKIGLYEDYNELFFGVYDNHQNDYKSLIMSSLYKKGLREEVITDAIISSVVPELYDKVYRAVRFFVPEDRIIDINHSLVHRKVDDSGTNFHINTPKTEAGCRRIPMIGEVYDAFLEEYQIQQITGFCTQEIDGYKGFVFCTSHGTVTIPAEVNRAIHSIVADYNAEETAKAKEEGREARLLPDFSAHTLRHTFCTRLCENETNLKVIQTIMGHKDIQTTMDIYADCTEDKKKDVIQKIEDRIFVI